MDELFIEIFPLKKANAKTIYETLVDCLKKKNIQLSKLIGWRLMGQQLFLESIKEFRAYSRRILLTLYSCIVIVIYCNLHVFKHLTVNGIKHVYTALTTLWKFFHYSPKRAECLKEVQRVLNLPELISNHLILVG